MQESQDEFKELGINIVALSYDNPQILAEFSKRQGIKFPLLADADSSSIRKLGLLNPQGTGMTKGVAFPGTIYLNKKGEIEELFFSESYKERLTPGTIISKIFPEAPKAESPETEEFRLSQTGDTGITGTQWDLLVTFPLPDKSHLYAPNESGYIPLQITLEQNPWVEFGQAIFPESEVMDFSTLGEKVPVYSGEVVIRVPVTVSASEQVKALTLPEQVTLKGKLRYQICTDVECYMPQEKALEWKAVVKPMDRKRAETEKQHK